jgi:RNA polymerase sigma-70 factor (ECF subfamily)
LHVPFNKKVERMALSTGLSSVRTADEAADGLFGPVLLARSSAGRVREMTDAQEGAGAADWLEAAVHSHARLLYRLAYSVVRNQADAEDVVQETFVRAMRSRGGLKDVRNVRAWLARITWNVALDHRRKVPALNLDDLNESGVSPDVSAERIASQRQQLDLVHQLIASLPRKLREPLLLLAVEELSSAEVGLLLGISEHSVRTRVMRARQMLKEKFSRFQSMPGRDRRSQR